jgi:hypothetical protein
MNNDLAITDVDEPVAVSHAQLIACPQCGAGIAFDRSPVPHMDECGFESYRFACTECGAPIVGIIDSADDTLLLLAETVL